MRQKRRATKIEIVAFIVIVAYMVIRICSFGIGVVMDRNDALPLDYVLFSDFDKGENVRYNRDADVYYYNNRLELYFEDEATEEQKQKVIDMLGGKVIKEDEILNVSVIEIQPMSYKELNGMASSSKSFTAVDRAYISTVDLIEPQ